MKVYDECPITEADHLDMLNPCYCPKCDMLYCFHCCFTKQQLFKVELHEMSNGHYGISDYDAHGEVLYVCPICNYPDEVIYPLASGV